MSRVRHYNGGKFSGSHTTAIEATVPVLKRAAELAQVTKIVLGIIKQKSGGEYRVKFTPIPAGLRMVARSPGAVQEVFIFTAKRSEVESLLHAAFEESH